MGLPLLEVRISVNESIHQPIDQSLPTPITSLYFPDFPSPRTPPPNPAWSDPSPSSSACWTSSYRHHSRNQSACLGTLCRSPDPCPCKAGKSASGWTRRKGWSFVGLEGLCYIAGYGLQGVFGSWSGRRGNPMVGLRLFSWEWGGPVWHVATETKGPFMTGSRNAAVGTWWTNLQIIISHAGTESDLTPTFFDTHLTNPQSKPKL